MSCKNNIYKEFLLLISMIKKKNFQDLVTFALVIGLFVLAIIIIKPIALSIIFGVLLAYIFYPLYTWTLSKIKNENLSAFLICLGLIAVILVIAGLILNSLVNQAINFYLYMQNANLFNIIKDTFPSFLSSIEPSAGIMNSLNSFISTIISDFIKGFGDFILNFPKILLQLFIVIFIFFFSLKDGKKGIEYIRSLSPLKKEIQEKFFKQFKNVTYSVLIGQILVGALQGIIAGIGFFIFKVPNPLLLTLLAMFFGIIPLIGPWLVWVPADIYLFAAGRTGAGLGLLIYGLIISSGIDTLVRSLIVSKKTQINPTIIIIGMIGGLLVFGILGLIIGPLVLAYVLLIIELYRKNTKSENLVFKEVESKSFNPLKFNPLKL